MSQHEASSRPKPLPGRSRGRYSQYTLARLQALSARLAAIVRPDTAPLAIALAGPTDRICVDDAIGLSFRPAKVGAPLGPQWATWWARLDGAIPSAWRGSPVELRWASRCEALLRVDSEPIGGLNVGREQVRLVGSADGGERLSLLLEVACNATFGTFEEWTPFAPQPDYQIDACELVRVDADAWALYHDFETLRSLLADADPPQITRATGSAQPVVRRPGLDSTWSGRLLHRLNAVANALDPDDRATWVPARAMLAELLATTNGSCVHEASAIGHAHIDTAWLWPIDETRRKCARSFATVLNLMERYPTFRFAASQAWQYDQMERHEPALFRRIQAKVKSGQWLPVGGTWVEPDCNLPSGESLCRQFLYGQRWFESRFGARCRSFWNPDVFGYDGQLPQIMREAGIDRFLTQKLSWNRFTAPPHHSFRWRGIDGSEVLTHFPPADTYNGRGTIEELRYHAANYKDADRSIDGLYLFGFGDGGGGPTAEMIERLERSGDLLGVPRVTMRGPDDFFDLLEKRSDDLQTVVGELYFEYHRGTYTTDAETKRLNRRCQDALQDLDLACVLAGDRAPPRPEVEDLWRAMLTQQFHDILPGTSIAEVHSTSRATLDEVLSAAGRQADRLLDSAARDAVPFNTLGMPRTAVIRRRDGSLGYVEAGPFASARWIEPNDRVSWRWLEGGGLAVENSHIAATLTATGELASLFDKSAGREALSGEGNRIVLYDDRPTDWDAWDIDPFALETGREAPAGRIVDAGGEPLRAWVRVERRLGPGSSMVQTITLDASARMLVFAAELEWQERHTLMKAQFPLAVRSNHATYETMFGTAARPTHANTDAAAAQFEVPAQRWADLGDGAFGVALLSDARHGFSCRDSELALSLIRGPTWPNPDADRGTHRFRYALMPHVGGWQGAGVVREAAAFARPWRWISEKVAAAIPCLATIDSTSVVIDSIKPSEDGNDIVFRLYEACGQSGDCRVALGFEAGAAWRSNILEDSLEPLKCEQDTIVLSMRPYELATLKVRRA